MPRYHFHIHDGSSLPDQTGTELVDLADARVAAVRLAGALLKDDPDRVALGQDWHIEVTDDAGQLMLRLTLMVANSPDASDETAA